MPALAELQTRYGVTPKSVESTTEQGETLVSDARSKMSPAQMVELKLRTALHGTTLARAGLITASGQRRAAK